MFLLWLFLALACLVCGYVIGLVQQGIHIHHHKEQELPKEYNESLVDYLPPEVQNYYHSTNGQNKF